jgi:hypothetical protein
MVFLVFGDTSRADIWLVFAEVRCDPADGSVTVTPDILDEVGPTKEWLGQLTAPKATAPRTFRLTADVDYGECVLADGTSVRVRMGLGAFRPYGEGAADPPQWISVWVNRRKWISHQQLGGFGERNVTAEVKIRADGVRTCEWKERESGDACRAWTLPKSELPDAVDAAEFPRSGKRVRTGTIGIREGTSRLCSAMLNRKEGNLGLAAWEITPPAGSITEFPPSSPVALTLKVADNNTYREELFDANNDGVEDIVLSVHPETHAQDADIYFRVDPDSYYRIVQSHRTMNDFVREALFTYPFGWADCCHGATYVEGSDNNYLDSRLPFTAPFDGTDAHWRPRYLHIVPFVNDKTTYFLVSTVDSWFRRFTYVVKPLPDDSFERVCLFERVEPNF